jgi:hypothetical protein
MWWLRSEKSHVVDYFKILSSYSWWNDDSLENQEKRCPTKIPNGIS